jgi:hypothetical protein
MFKCLTFIDSDHDTSIPLAISPSSSPVFSPTQDISP